MSDNNTDLIVNDQLICIAGESASGKSMSLKDLPNPEGVLYLNFEGKRLPFRSKFEEVRIVDPYHVYEAIEYAKASNNNHTIVFDTITFMMQMFNSVHIQGADNTMTAWNLYGEFFKNLMQQYLATCDLNVIMLAHVDTVLDEKTMSYKTSIPVSGSLKKNGLEAYFSMVLATKAMTIDELKKLQVVNDCFEITEEDEFEGVKYVFQTRKNKQTIGERIRSPYGFWKREELFIDNNCANVLRKLKEYYAPQHV